MLGIGKQKYYCVYNFFLIYSFLLRSKAHICTRRSSASALKLNYFLNFRFKILISAEAI